MQTPDATLCLSILAEAPVGVACVDADGKLTWCNAAFAKLAGRSLDELDGLDEASLLTNREVSTVQRITTDLASGQRVIYYRDMGKEEALRRERDALAEQLQQHSTIDPVSGLLNQQAVNRGLDPLVSRSRRYDNPLSVVTMSLTNLPLLRDEQGDSVADEVLLTVSRLLRDQIRWADLIGRLDNGDFIFVLPETGQSAAESLAGKISRQLRESSIEALNDLHPVGSFGVADWRKGDDAKLLINRANEALQKAVAAGQYSVVAA